MLIESAERKEACKQARKTDRQKDKDRKTEQEKERKRGEKERRKKKEEKTIHSAKIRAFLAL